MARTLINETAISRDADINTAAAGVYQNADSVNGMYIAEAGKAGTLLLHFKNTNAATRDVTIQSGSGGDVGPSFRSVLGDLVFTLAVTSGEELVWITDTARFAQSDGQIWIDFSAATNVTVGAFRLAGL